MSEQRIKLTDSMPEVLMSMSEGNPGALNVLMEIIKKSQIIDPDNKADGIAVILFLDSLGIYGTDIYILHNDICENDIVMTLAVLRATQFGMFSESVLKDACGRQDRSGRDLVPVQELYLKVKERLPKFNQ